MEDQETSIQNFQWVTTNDGLDIVEGPAPSEAVKEATHGVRAGDVAAPTTPGVTAHRGKEKNEENFWMMVRSWTGSQLIRELLGTSGLKEGAVGAVVEQSPQRKKEQFARR
jgi:hypothetical protein